MTELFDDDHAPLASRIRPRPPLTLRDEIVTIQQAARVVNRSEKTIRDWNYEHGIGQQSGPSAPIEISWLALLMVAAGDFKPSRSSAAMIAGLGRSPATFESSAFRVRTSGRSGNR